MALQTPNLANQPVTPVTTAQAEACQEPQGKIIGTSSGLYDPEITDTSWTPTEEFKNFQEKHFHRHRKLTFDQVCDILEEQAVPSVDALVAPVFDPSMLQHVAASNKKFIQERDRELAGIRRAMLNATGSLCTSHDQLKQGVTLESQDLKLILQQTLCLLGSANTQLSTIRRKKILASINKSKIDLATQPLPNAKKWLFGDDFPICEVPFCEDGFFSRFFVAPKRDRSMRPIIDLSPLNRFISTPHFQMENLATVKFLLRQGHFMTKIDLKDAYFSVAIPPSESEIPEIPVAKQSIPVLFSSVRSEHCTVSVYSPHETSSRFPEETGRSPTPVPGRYAHNWFDPSRSQRLHPDGCESPKSVWVHNQPGQIGSNHNSGYNVSRVHNQFNNHAFHSTLRESAEITNTVPTDSFELEGSPSNPGPTSGSFGILSPGRVASTSSFSLPTSSPHQRSEPNESQLRGSSFVMLSVPRGNQLVATESRNSQWQPDYNAIFRSDNIHRRLFDGPRSCLWEHQNQREVVCHRETVAYKCSRTEGGNVGSTVAPEKSKFENNIPEYGQLYSGGLYQPKGGHSLPRASPGGTTTLELVHSAQPIHNSISCSRENQCGCRSRVERIYRQQRLENRPDNHFSLSE